MNKRFTPLEITGIRRRDKENKSLTGFNVSKKVIVGGTFDILHRGHKALLRKAFKLVEEDKSSSSPFANAREVKEISSLLPPRFAREVEEDKSSSSPFAAAREGEVTIGLTSNIMVRKIKKREVENFKHRKKELEDFIAREFKVKPRIVKIEDKFGPTLKEDFDYIVVSPATYPTATLINKARQKRNKKPIKIVKIEFVLAEDRKPISTTRILKGEIDRNGKLLK